MTLVGGINTTNSMGLHPTNKFNTISNVHKRGGGNAITKSITNDKMNFIFQVDGIEEFYLTTSILQATGIKSIITKRVLC